MKTVTLAKWEAAKRQGYTETRDGKPWMLYMDDNGATVWGPVHIDKRHQGWVHTRKRLAEYKAAQRRGEV
jgi:hypothetical protein